MLHMVAISCQSQHRLEAGNVVQGQRAQRIEMLLLHEFHARKFLLPDKLTGRERERQNKRQHAAVHGEDAKNVEEVKAGMYLDSAPYMS